jgi:hypothetical protein
LASSQTGVAPLQAGLLPQRQVRPSQRLLFVWVQAVLQAAHCWAGPGPVGVQALLQHNSLAAHWLLF